tara:strand:+ start:422 stop:796 length:375 start_codon:yes stop_codon:yes gene_type:complete
MTHPWYEMTGPSAEEVRKDVLKELNIVKVGKIDFKEERDKIINDTIMEIIPDSRNDFGSWRGYSTFGIVKIIAKEIIKEVRKKYALLTIEKKLIPYIKNYLYNLENGKMIKKNKSTLIEKSISG